MRHVHVAYIKLRLTDLPPNWEDIANELRGEDEALAGCRFVKLDDERRMLITVWVASDKSTAEDQAKSTGKTLVLRLYREARPDGLLRGIEDIAKEIGEDVLKDIVEDFVEDAGDVEGDVAVAWVAANLPAVTELTLTFGALILL